MLSASCFFLCLGLAAASTVSITDFEVPYTASVGDTVELRCLYALHEAETALFYVKWWWTPVGGTKTQIYQRLGHGTGQSKHEGLVIKENDTIELEEVQPDDSGEYECEVSNNNEARQKGELIVFTPGTGPQLNLTTVEDGDDDEDVVISCDAFDVAPAEAELLITVNGKAIDPKEVTIIVPEGGMYSLSSNATVEDLDSGAEVRCELYYKNDKITHQPYVAAQTYQKSGAELTTPEPMQDSTEWETTTALPDGADAKLLSISCLGVIVIATLVQLFMDQ